MLTRAEKSLAKILELAEVVASAQRVLESASQRISGLERELRLLQREVEED